MTNKQANMIAAHQAGHAWAVIAPDVGSPMVKHRAIIDYGRWEERDAFVAGYFGERHRTLEERQANAGEAVDDKIVRP